MRLLTVQIVSLYIEIHDCQATFSKSLLFPRQVAALRQCKDEDPHHNQLETPLNWDNQMIRRTSIE